MSPDKNLWNAKTSADRGAYILALLLAGVSQKAMAIEFGVSPSLISLRAHGAYDGSPYEVSHPTLLNRSRAVDSRFWDFVIPEPNSGCWIYFGGDNGHGYGSFGGHRGIGRRYAHRIAYEELVGPVPDGLELDHTRKTRCCCNPDHLEPVTRLVNSQRAAERGALFNRNHEKTHCRWGHPFSGSNLTIKTRSNGRTYRSCKVCEAAAQVRYRSKLKCSPCQ